MGGTAQAQAPAAEVQALTHRLNELARIPKTEDNAEVLVSLADCGVKQTFRKFRASDKPSTTNINVSSNKKGGGWGVKSDDKVELEFNLSLAWEEVGSIKDVPKKEEKTGRSYYDLTVKRRDKAPGQKSSGLADAITFSLHTQDEKEVAALVRRLEAVSRSCSGRKS
jgi:hypothetical protein